MKYHIYMFQWLKKKSFKKHYFFIYSVLSTPDTGTEVSVYRDDPALRSNHRHPSEHPVCVVPNGRSNKSSLHYCVRAVYVNRISYGVPRRKNNNNDNIFAPSKNCVRIVLLFGRAKNAITIIIIVVHSVRYILCVYTARPSDH